MWCTVMIDTPPSSQTLKWFLLTANTFQVELALWRHQDSAETLHAGMFFSQDPMLLYPQPPYMQTGPAIPRSPPSRPSFLIDDLLVRRQSPYLVPKPPQEHPHEPQVPSSSGTSYNFGMPALFSRSRKEHSTVYQGIFPLSALS